MFAIIFGMMNSRLYLDIRIEYDVVLNSPYKYPLQSILLLLLESPCCLLIVHKPQGVAIISNKFRVG